MATGISFVPCVSARTFNYVTTLAGAQAFVSAIENLRRRNLPVIALQDLEQWEEKVASTMADILDKTGVVISNRQVSDRLWIIDIKVDAFGADLMPEQFVHMSFWMEGHILRRPFSVFYVSEDGSVITILYQVVGFGSKHLTTVEAGMAVSLMGPIGHGWNAPEGVSSALLVAGGVGAAPLFLHAQELVASGIDVEVVMGAQSDKAFGL